MLLLCMMCKILLIVRKRWTTCEESLLCFVVVLKAYYLSCLKAYYLSCDMQLSCSQHVMYILSVEDLK